ncbi:MAG: tetratricopeptide repeat protein, partial [Chloroflexi bacterium]|nr:tetratricopeptide repeat protein [Chloroflexota bacterium]
MSWARCEAPACEREAIVVLYDVGLCHTHHMASIDGLRRLGVLALPSHQITRDDVVAAITSTGRPRTRPTRVLELTAEQEQVLTELALFAGGCSEQAFATVGEWSSESSAQLRTVLGQLAARALVTIDLAHGRRRYALADAGRSRTERLNPDERLRRRHADYYLGLAEDTESQLWGPAVVAAMDALDEDFENLSSALRWCIQEQELPLALRFVAALWRFWDVRGHGSQGLQWLDEALRTTGDVEPVLRGRAFDAGGTLARNLGRHELATRYFVRSLQTWLQLGNRQGVALALTNLGLAALYGGDEAASAVHFTAGNDLFRELKDEPGMAVSLVTLGTRAVIQGNKSAAKPLYEESLALFEKLGDARGIAGCLNNLANLIDDEGRRMEARDLYLRALELYRTLGDAGEEAACLKNLAASVLAAGDPKQAARFCNEALSLFDELSDGRGLLSTLSILARTASASGQHVHAVRLIGAIDALRLMFKLPEDISLRQLADVETASLERLGSPRFVAARAQGARMSLAKVVADATASIERQPDPAPEERRMSKFLVERHLPGFKAEQLAAAASAAKKATTELSAQGTPVRYLRSTYVP